MNGKTHMSISIAASPLVIDLVNTNSLLFTIPLVLLGSLMTDIDKENSKISNMFRRYSMVIVAGILVLKVFPDIFKDLFPDVITEFSNKEHCMLGIDFLIIYLICAKVSKHRTFTHSILGAAICGIGVFLIAKNALIPFMLGYILHLLADMVTMQGVPLIYPYNKRFALRLFSTGSIIEEFINIACVGIFFTLLYFKV